MMGLFDKMKAWAAPKPAEQAAATFQREPPMIHQGAGRYPVHEVIIHTTATGADWHKGKTAQQMVDEIRVWHKRLTWRDIGYHGLIAPDGSYAQGRAFTEIGAHTMERNRGTIGLALVPVRDVDHRRMGRFEDYYTEQQRIALKANLAALSVMTDLKWVTGHNDYTAMKTCPGFHVKQEEWL